MRTAVDTVLNGVRAVPRWKALEASQKSRVTDALFVDLRRFLEEHCADRYGRLTAKLFHNAAVQAHHVQSSAVVLYWRHMLKAIVPTALDAEHKLSGKMTDHRSTQQETLAHVGLVGSNDPSKKDKEKFQGEAAAPGPLEAKLAHEKFMLTTDDAKIQVIRAMGAVMSQTSGTHHVSHPARSTGLTVADADAFNHALSVRCTNLILTLVGQAITYVETVLEELISPQTLTGNLFLRFVLQRERKISRARLSALVAGASQKRGSTPLPQVVPQVVNDVDSIWDIDFSVPRPGAREEPSEPSYEVAPPLSPAELEYVAAVYQLDAPSTNYERDLRNLSATFASLKPLVAVAIQLARRF
jgi:hypothetical protein